MIHISVKRLELMTAVGGEYHCTDELLFTFDSLEQAVNLLCEWNNREYVNGQVQYVILRTFRE